MMFSRLGTTLMVAAALITGSASAAGATTTSPASQTEVLLPGYHASAPAGSSWTVTGSMTIPTLACPAQGFAELDPSLYVHSLLFGDTDIDVGIQVVLECNNGTAVYRPVFLNKSLPSSPIPFAVSPGDTLKMTMVDDATPGGTFVVTARDGDQSASTSGGAFPVQTVRAEGIVQCLDAPRACGPPWPDFPPFGKIVYRHVTVNGLSLAQLGAVGSPGRNGVTGKVKTSPLDSTGAGFTLQWRHS